MTQQQTLNNRIVSALVDDVSVDALEHLIVDVEQEIVEGSIADWGKLADERRREDEERIERQLDDAEAAKREFYRPRD